MTARKIVVDTWSPEYGASIEHVDLEAPERQSDANVEVEAARWKPLRPSGVGPAGRLLFVDGVRRIDALVWIHPEGGDARVGLCASYAAGVLRAAAQAEVREVRVRRGLFSSAPGERLASAAGDYEPMPVAGDGIDPLVLGLQQRLGELEVQVATSLSESADLIVVDGPLSGRQNVPGGIGYVKTHRVAYLSPELNRVVHALEPGQRTPLFLTTTSWSRYSCYLRLPGPRPHPWAGVVRLEISADAPLKDAARRADLAAASLPRYASLPHKDPRAPQNLFPIAGLERELRHRLGDAALVHRALRVAASALPTGSS